MYRIRSASGPELVFNSLEEFSAAVRRGEVLPEDEIFHTRANRWLDVKSHPHYRTAISGQDVRPGPAAPVAAPAPARPTPGPSQSPAQSRAQVFERPVVKPGGQTTVGPQFQATPKPEAPKGPPPKSRELTFVDVGAPGTLPPNSMYSPKPQVPVKQEPKEPPKAKAPETELEFLVMNDGIESPVRTSAGYKAGPEDLNLLFDAPLPSQSETPKVPSATVVAGPLQSAPSGSRGGSGKVPAVAPAPAPVPPAPVVAAAPAPVVVAAPAPVVAAPPAPVVAAPPAPVVAAPPAPVVAAAPAPVVAAAPAPVVAAAPAPVVAAATARVVEDLDIPGGVLLQSAPTPRPAPASRPATDYLDEGAGPAPVAVAARQSRGMLIGTGVAVLGVAAVLLAWRPWSSTPSTSTAAAQPSPGNVASAPASEAPAPSATDVAQPTAPASNAPSTLPPAARPLPPAPAPAAARGGTDSEPETETVIAASKPNFKPVLSLPATPIAVDAGIGGGGGALVSPSEYARRLDGAVQRAQQELSARLSSAGFRTVLAPARLSNADGVAKARASWTAGADAIRQYRARIARLEQAYQDSVLTAQRAKRWSGEEMRAWAGRRSGAEPAEAAQLADLMFSQVGEGLEILSALDGQYTMKGDAIGFKNAGSATRYTSIRNWVEQRKSGWSATPEGARSYSVNAILRALGEGFPEAR